MSGHTPGPWLPSGWEFTDGNRSKFRFVIQFEHAVSGPIEANNNANLIAAAPDLLEALEFLNAYFDRDGVPGDIEDCGAYAKILAAIARAKGEA